MEHIGIKSRARVKDLGEVFTNPREVNAMLDLVEDYSYQINKSFLEPACGNGNFLIEILNRKLKTILSLKKIKESKDIRHFQLFTLKAISKIYGVDICSENVFESRERLKNRIIDVYRNNLSVLFIDDVFEANLDYILERNIQVGNFLDDNVEFSDFRLTDSYYFTEYVFLQNDLMEEENEDLTEKVKEKPIKVFQKKHFTELYKNKEEIDFISESDLPILMHKFMYNYLNENNINGEDELLINLVYLMMHDLGNSKIFAKEINNEKFYDKEKCLKILNSSFLYIEEAKGFDKFKIKRRKKRNQ